MHEIFARILTKIWQIENSILGWGPPTFAENEGPPLAMIYMDWWYLLGAGHDKISIVRKILILGIDIYFVIDNEISNR